MSAAGVGSTWPFSSSGATYLPSPSSQSCAVCTHSAPVGRYCEQNMKAECSSLSSEHSKVAVALSAQQQLALTPKSKPKATTSYMETCIPTDVSTLQAQNPQASECHQHHDICCLASHRDARLHLHVENGVPAGSAKSYVSTREQAF